MKPNAERPYFFRSKQLSLPPADPIHAQGYKVLKNALKLDERVLEHTKKACKKNTHSIFNHNEQSRNDFKRRQRNLLLNTKYMLAFDRQVKDVLRSQVSTELTPKNPVIIHSRPGCQPQAAHCDYIPDDALKAVNDQQMPLAALISLMPNTHLRIWPNSSKLATTDQTFLKRQAPIMVEEVLLNPGDIIVFRGDFVHAGSEYENDNFRIHYYLDSPLVPRTANRTWLIEDSGHEQLIRIIQNNLNPVEARELKRASI